MLNKTDFHHTQYQYMLDTVNCFVGLTNVIQNTIIRHNNKNSYKDAIIPVLNRLWDQIIEFEHKASRNSSVSIIYNMSRKRLVSFFLAIQKMRKYSSTKSDGDGHHPAQHTTWMLLHWSMPMLAQDYVMLTVSID